MAWFAGLMLQMCLGCVGQGGTGASAGMAETGQIARVGSPVRWRLAESSREWLRVGQEFRADLQATVAPGWHLYALDEAEDGPAPLEFSTQPGGPFVLVSVAADRPERGPGSNGGAPANFYEGHPTFRLRLRGTRASDTSAPAAIEVRFQACNSRVCLPRRTVTVPLPVRVSSGTP